MEYAKRLRQLKARRQDQDYVLKSFSVRDAYPLLNEAYETLAYPDSVKYVIGGMTEVGQAYTKICLREAERVATQLEALKPLGLAEEFGLQGSVTNNTHIKAASDVDLLVFTSKYFCVKAPLQPISPYRGNPLDDLAELRNSCISILTKAFPAVKIDNSGSKAISLSGGSLQREVDVVPCNWCDTVEYRQSSSKTYRGIEVFDKDKLERVLNFPYLHNHAIESKDKAAISNLRPAIRLLKTIRADSDRAIDVSSYAISAIAYSIETEKLAIIRGSLEIVSLLRDQLIKLFQDDAYRNSILVPNRTSKLSEILSKIELSKLALDVGELCNELEQDLKRIGRALNETIQ